MAKFTKRAIMHSFMEILSRKPIDRITVKDICEHCEINRNTFYYYYRDIYDVLKEAFAFEKIKLLKELEQVDSFYEDYKICAALIYSHRKAILNIYKSKAGDMMGSFSRTVINSYVGRFVSHKGNEAGITEEETERITKFCGQAVIGYALQWLDDGIPEYDEGELKQLVEMMEIAVDAMIQNCPQKEQNIEL